MNWLLVVVGAAVGASLRHLATRYNSAFPWGTFVVNVVGSFALGLLTGVASSQVQLLLGAGLCGALTTYSTFSYETLKLYESGAKTYTVLNVVGSVAVGLGAVWVGVEVARAW